MPCESSTSATPPQPMCLDNLCFVLRPRKLGPRTTLLARLSAADPMTRCISVILATLLLAPAAALAKPKTTFTIRGAGFGHGVGMSQYGAMGYASHGWSAASILAHYYSGTSLGTTDPSRRMRIQLVASAGSARISGAVQAGSRKLDPARTYVVRRNGISQVSLSTGGKR